MTTPTRVPEYLEPLFAHEPSFHKALFNGDSKLNPKSPIPLSFAIVANGVSWKYTFKSIIIEGPKSVLGVYSGVTTADPYHPKDFIVKYQLKYKGQRWGEKIATQVRKRYYNPNRGDELCSKLPQSSRLCQYYGTYILITPLNQGWTTSTPVSSTAGIEDHDDEAWVIQIFEYIAGQDLYTFLNNRNNPYRFDLTTLYQIAVDVNEGLHILHKNNIYHGDMKPENVMIRDGDQRAVIIDFDFASSTLDERLKRGTPRYLSPEYVNAYRGEGIDLAGLGALGREFDQWAVGAIIWALFYNSSNRFYFTSYTTDQLKEKKVKNKAILSLLDSTLYQDHLNRYLMNDTIVRVPTRLKSLLSSLLAFNPRKRPSAGMACERLKYIVLKEKERKALPGTSSVDSLMPMR